MTRLKCRFCLALGITILGAIFFVGMEIGNVNWDVFSNLLDVEPFIDAALTKTFDPKDAIDQNGVVDPLESDLFKAVLGGG